MANIALYTEYARLSGTDSAIDGVRANHATACHVFDMLSGFKLQET